MDRLLEAIYGEDLPPTSRAQAQISISSLRRLFATHGHDGVITTRDHGYVIRVDHGQLDARQFEELVAAARTARKESKPDLAIAKYRDALRLWRGPALDGMYSELVQAAVSRLDEQRIAANEDRLELELEAGRHHELVGELSELVAEFPLRERLRGQLMLAMYRCDRTVEALQVYRQARRTMIDELGIEPSERLQQLEHAILASDPVLEPQSPPVRAQPVKRQVANLLPADIADFTGRTEEIGRISKHLISADGEEVRLVAPIVVLVGKGGIGKTSIAVHAAHGMASHFPDGLLYADLHGGASHPVHSMQVLERFLRACGVHGTQIPEGLDERAEVYRNLLADQKVLVVLDDAAGESQISPLLPGSGAAAVIITSRRRLAGLAGATRIEVDVFDAGKSLDMLARIVGAARVQAQSEAAAEVAEHCGHLPLALRIAGARLAARPHWSVQRLVDRLADETHRLDELRHGDMGIRPSISLIYESAGQQARRLFRRLALLDMPIFSGWLSAALLDRPLHEAEDVLDDLVNAQLIETTGGGSGVDSQYRFHDLIRVFARERLAAEEPAAERKASLERALGGLLYLAEEARCRYYSGDYLRIQNDGLRWPLPAYLVDHLVADPLSWYDHERASLVAGVRQAAQAGFVELCWGLASSAVTLFDSRTYLDDWRETHDIALEATRKAHHVRGQAAMLYTTGTLHMTQQRFDPAREELNAAAELFRETDDDHGLALVIRHIAFIDRLGGRLEDATKRYEQALTIFRQTGDHIGCAYVLQQLAQIKLEFREFDQAQKLLSEALLLCRTAHCGRIEAQVLYRMGEAYLLSGELAPAIETFELALTMIRDVGDPIGEAYVLQGIGIARLRQGGSGPARTALQRALELSGGVGERLAEARALLGLSELALASGDPGQAVILGERAAGVFRGLEAPLYQAQALTLLSDAYSALGDAEAAHTSSADAAILRTKQHDVMQIPYYHRPLALPGGAASTCNGVASGAGSHPCRPSTWRSRARAAGLPSPAAVARAAVSNSSSRPAVARWACWVALAMLNNVHPSRASAGASFRSSASSSAPYITRKSSGSAVAGSPLSSPRSPQWARTTRSEPCISQPSSGALHDQPQLFSSGLGVGAGVAAGSDPETTVTECVLTAGRTTTGTATAPPTTRAALTVAMT
jgi:DNA-binding SARP family transcriptional activator/tetratricopeptide (TPR) repeat protein